MTACLLLILVLAINFFVLYRRVVRLERQQHDTSGCVMCELEAADDEALDR